MVTNLTVGKLGEDIAVEYLTLNKYCVLYRNYREKFGELDIIAKKSSGVLIVFEIKTLVRDRWTKESLTPEDEMTIAKIIKLKRTAEYFVRNHSELIDEKRGWRIDVIAIDIPPHMLTTADPKILLPKVCIRHYENI